MVPVRSPLGLRFFRHAPRAPRCSLSGGESIDHHLLKLELAHASRAVGYHAEYEVAAPDRSWRADVMATSPDGAQRMALEAQLSPITPEDIQQRTNRYEQDGVEVCWFGLKPRLWVGTVPSILLNSGHEGGGWSVSAGIARMTKLDQDSSFQQWVPVEGVSLTDSVAWILTGRMRPHRPQSLAKSVLEQVSRQWPSSWVGQNSHGWDVWWTTSSHIETDIQQHNDYREQVHLAILRAESPLKAFRVRAKIENISALEKLILKQFNNNAMRSLADFQIRLDSNYADGLAFYGYRWDGSGTMRDLKPFVVVCPDILDRGSQYWTHSVPVAFPVTYRDRLENIKNVWLFDLEKGAIWPIEPKKSVTDAALESWKSVKPTDSSSPDMT
ncbi:competence protein CoiA family protein [Streptomyces sp. NPDC005492]|uniref:competence protein CoiA family protein n=1 Tax=Streptomyces sp. NPDC005492 TaxID=3156883 RepID=UPI0033ABCC4B